MMRIIDGLYLGNREDARDLGRMEIHGITHVLNCTQELPNYHDGTLKYCALGLTDPDPAFRDCIVEACAFIDEARQHGGVLVHCFAAVSRSPSMVLAYLCHSGHSLRDAATFLSGIAWTNPDLLFLKQLSEHVGEEYSDEDLERLSMLLCGRPWDAED